MKSDLTELEEDYPTKIIVCNIDRHTLEPKKTFDSIKMTLKGSRIILDTLIDNDYCMGESSIALSKRKAKELVTKLNNLLKYI